MSQRSEPVAIIGMGCRLPGGVTDRDSLWELLRQGVDAVRPVPGDRWDADRFYSPKSQQPGRMSAREAGFLDGIDGFDASFFGISARVAEQMDPQQRLLLEVSWEALEDAGVVPDRIAGGDTGVFIGACSQDYGGLQSSPGELERLGPHSATGTFMSILSNRLSYTLDLRGPSMTIDTACSSSLVAVHLACQSLHRGEAGLALAGGVNLMLTPQFPIALSQASMLSPDSRSRAFDASANGYVRGEGAGVVVLKPLGAAVRDGDRVYAVIRGSAVNQDGRTQGITLPSATAQEANFRDALTAAGVAGSEIGYVEAHGTGTPVGDPIEANALGRVLSEDRPTGRPAHIGSIKTNIGHLEAGAGIAGLIKATLSVHRGEIPPSIHYRSPNPAIDFDGLRMTVPTEPTAWPEHYATRLAAVNSFGFGGTNANVVLGEAPAAVPGDLAAGSGTPTVLTLSARGPEALTRLATATADRLAGEPSEPVALEPLGAYLALRRSHHQHRLAVVASAPADAAAKLRRFVDGDTVAEVTAGAVRRGRGKLAFLFNGQGPQWYAMGRTLLETSPVYRAKILECDRLARRYLSWSIHEELLADEASSRVQMTYCLQPTMFALQVALTELWKTWGIVPDGVLGHSMGEIAAAHVSGALDLDTALRVICHRSRIQEKADPTGAMMFLALGADETAALCDRYDGDVWVAAHNSPRASTLSGRRELLDKIAADLAGEGVFARILRVNCACHSPDMEPLREELLATLAGVRGSESAIPFYSTVDGAQLEGTALNTDYWWRNFRQPVLFEPGMRAMLADGFDTFVELSPHPVLANSAGEIVADGGTDSLVLSSLSRKKDDWSCFLGAFGALYTAGREITWTARFPGGAPVTDLPTNPWVRESYWNESEVSRRDRVGGQPHPMLKAVDAVRPTWEIRWDDHRLGWVNGHDVLGAVIVPGASYVEAALAAARELTTQPCGLSYVSFDRACVLSAEEQQVSRIELDPEDGTFEVHHRPVRGTTWARAVRGRFHRDPAAVEGLARTINLDELRARCDRRYPATEVYGVLRAKGYRYGPAFCGIEQLYVGRDESLARVVVPRTLRRSVDGYLFHPAVLDACFQSAILHPAEDRPADLLPRSYLPTGIENVRFHANPGRAAWVHSVAHKHDSGGLLVDILVLDDEGRAVAEYTRLHGKVVPSATADSKDRIERHLYRLGWQPDRSTPAPTRARGALTLAPTEVGERLAGDIPGLARRLGRDTYAGGYQASVRELCVAYVVDCLRAFEVSLTAESSFSVDNLPELLPRLRPAALGQLRSLVQDGVLDERDGRFTTREVPDRDTGALWARAIAEHPSCASELLLLQRTGGRLHDVLTGRVDPLELLFPTGSRDHTESIYQSSPIARLYNLIVTNAVQELVATADPSRTVRILEVGGGTGGLTAGVLAALPSDHSCEYVFTDVSATFVRAARERFGGYGFVDFQVLDLEHDLLGQGLAPGSFDLVLASDVVHATEDLRKTLMHLGEVLAPSGVLALLEAAPGNRWLDLTFGLTVGWWSFRDLGLRPDGPLLPAEDWQRVLEAAGYDDVASLTDPGHPGPGSQSVLLARAPQLEPVVPLPPQPTRAARWVILTDRGNPLSAALACLVADRGGSAVCTDRTDHPALGEPDLAGVVQLVPSGLEHDGATAVAEGSRACLRATELLRAVAQRSPRVYLVTRGVHALRNDRISLAGAPVWGFGTVAGLEFPGTRLTLVDLPAEPGPIETDAGAVDAGEAEALWDVLSAGGSEREVVLRGGHRFHRRLKALPPAEVTPPVAASELPADAGYALELDSPGTLDELRFAAAPRVAPGAGQLEIEVVSAGLNYLDVMIALGQVPTLESARSHRFGAECAGVVTRVGAGVTDFRAGDPVIAVQSAQGTIASHLTLDAVNVVAKPAQLSFEEAATTPIVFLTAWYALTRLARLEPGERVLIHSAAGGTGLAAVQIARRAGAEVFATAGSPEKRALLRSLGVRHVMDSRSLEFVDEIHRITGGAGVDVVLNSIAGEAAARSLDCLAPYGRFVEIGKRDLLNDRRLGLRPFLRNLAYFSFDLRQLLVDAPREVRDELEGLIGLLADGELRPLPFRVFAPAQVEAAFRHMAAGRHLGKLVISMDERAVPVLPIAEPAPEISGGTWLVTGGLGGFGLAMAEQLVGAGVRHLVLVGRTGAAEPAAERAVEELRARGAEVLVASVDVTARAALAELFERIGRELPPLDGVLHCAMVLDDALLTEMDSDRLHRVMRPKALGAWYLHELTADLPLRAFVLFSSATSMIGNTGQANYGAANGYLDHLAEYRRAQGLPALAINWGAVSDAGYLARNRDVARIVASTGMRDFTAAQAYAAMTLLWSGSHPGAGVLPLDWPRFFQRHGFNADTQPRYSEMYESQTTNSAHDAGAGGSLRDQLRTRSDTERTELLRSSLKGRVATVLGMPPAELDDDKPLMDYLDSLLAVEISAWLERELGAKVTIMELMKGPSVAQLTEQLLGRLAGAGSAPTDA